MPIILLIRHAENDYVKQGRLAGRQPGVHLNEAGKAQALALVERLKGAPIKAVYASPLERALETARPLAESLGLPVIERPGLIETDYGEWMQGEIKKLKRTKLWRLIQTSPSLARFPGGESFVEAQFRICQEIEALRCVHGEKDLLACVTHADPIKLAVAHYVGMPLDAFQRLSISPASITVLQVGEGGSRLLAFNCGAALPFKKT